MRGRRAGGLLARVRWPGCGTAADAPGRPGDGRPAARGGERPRVLDWQKAQTQLGPVRTVWDLGILANLDANDGCRPKDLLAAINAQAKGRHLYPQVLSGRLRELEERGYISHEDLSVIPLIRIYHLKPSGRRLIADIFSIVRPAPGDCDEDSAAGGHR